MSNQASSNADQQTTANGKKSYPQQYTDWYSFRADTPPTEQLSDTPAKNSSRQRIPNATRFHPSDAPKSTQEWYEKLESHNRDMEKDYRVDIELSERVIYEMKLEVMKILGKQLEVGGSLTSIGTRQIFRLDLSEVGLPASAVGFCLYAHLYDEATTAYEARTPRRYHTTSPGTNRPYWPFRDSDANLPPFNRVADNLINFYPNVTESSLQSVLQRLSQQGLPTRVGGYRPTNTELLSK